MQFQSLINPKGESFLPKQLDTIGKALSALNDDQRKEYRDQNAREIAEHDSAKCLIVSGPGTGKSFLFLERIKNWFKKNPDAKVLVTSFVRKLVADLQSDIQNSKDLTEAQKQQIEATTLHGIARSIVERSHGTSNFHLAPHFQIIGQIWKELVWQDVLAFHPELDVQTYTCCKYEHALHDGNFPTSKSWSQISDSYLRLSQFYNALGFADLIIHAKTALSEKHSLTEERYFIIDEYQDFNLSEENLINELTANSTSILIVGDDDQVLYESLKSSKQEFIRKRYTDTSFTKAMLPFCGRSSYHIAKVAEHFIKSKRESQSIEKIYLPITIDNTTPKVRVIACATAGTAVDYVSKFIADKKSEINQRKQDIDGGKAKDAYVLLLAQSSDLKFYNKYADSIKKVASEYRVEVRSYSDDYYRLKMYYSLAKNPKNNFVFRKVLYYQNVSIQRVHELISKALDQNCRLCDILADEITYAITLCNSIKAILDNKDELEHKFDLLAEKITLSNVKELVEELKLAEDNEKEETEIDDLEVQQMGAVELMTIIGSKGLSADHVIILGFDDVNMKYVTANAFFVALTRARKSVHLITALKCGGATAAHPYIENLPAQNIEFYSYKKKDQVSKRKSNLAEFKNYISSIQFAEKMAAEKKSKKSKSE